MDKKIKKLLKNKRFIIVCILVLVGIICLILLKNILYPSGRISYYGNRLDGIENVEFTDKSKTSIVNNLKSNELITDAKINVHGKIINVIFDVKKDVSIEDAKKIGSELLNSFNDDIKGFYDIQVIITKTEEETVETTDSNGEAQLVKQFPIMGYKNCSSKEIVW